MTLVMSPGRFQQKHIENVLRRYIKEYVTCHTCRYHQHHPCLECYMIQLQIPGHDPEQGDEVVLPAVHDLPLLLQCPDHQDRFPGDALECTFWLLSHVPFSRPSLGREGYFEPKPPRRSLSRLPRSSPWSSWLCYSPSLCIYLAWPLSSSGFQLNCCG